MTPTLTPEFTVTHVAQAERVCIRLRALREMSGLSVDDIAKRTNLQRRYVDAIEACQFDLLPSGNLYRKQFIKTYLKALNINPAPYIFQYLSEEASTEKTNQTLITRPKRLHFQNLPAILRIAGLSVGAFIMIGYLGLQIKNIVDPPDLSLYNPTDGLITSESALIVQGETHKEVFIKINGKDVANNGSGQFRERIDLSPGVNAITVSAKRKYGKEMAVTRHVILRHQQESQLSNASVTSARLP